MLMLKTLARQLGILQKQGGYPQQMQVQIPRQMPIAKPTMRLKLLEITMKKKLR